MIPLAGGFGQRCGCITPVADSARPVAKSVACTRTRPVKLGRVLFASRLLFWRSLSCRMLLCRSLRRPRLFQPPPCRQLLCRPRAGSKIWNKQCHKAWRPFVPGSGVAAWRSWRSCFGGVGWFCRLSRIQRSLVFVALAPRWTRGYSVVSWFISCAIGVLTASRWSMGQDRVSDWSDRLAPKRRALRSTVITPPPSFP